MAGASDETAGMSGVVIRVADEKLRADLADALAGEAAGCDLTIVEDEVGAIHLQAGDHPAEIVLPPGAPLLETARAMARAARAERALRRSHENTRQLAWAVGHDLAEPLRLIVSYNQLLERRYKDQLDAEAIGFLGQTAAAAQRMRALL